MTKLAPIILPLRASRGSLKGIWQILERKSLQM